MGSFVFFSCECRGRSRLENVLVIDIALVSVMDKESAASPRLSKDGADSIMYLCQLSVLAQEVFWVSCVLYACFRRFVGRSARDFRLLIKVIVLNDLVR